MSYQPRWKKNCIVDASLARPWSNTPSPWLFKWHVQPMGARWDKQCTERDYEAFLRLSLHRLQQRSKYFAELWHCADNNVPVICRVPCGKTATQSVLVLCWWSLRGLALSPSCLKSKQICWSVYTHDLLVKCDLHN